MINGVATVWVPVEDLERAVGFYSDSLGLEVQNHDGDWAEVQADGLTIGLNEREDEGAGVSGGPVIAFRPEGGIEAAVDRLREKGVEMAAEISEHPWGKVATFKDSEGNDLQLYTPPSGD
jgi:predicted enzyme related to lactoylglutathione lyase